ncbi:hypothetical protein BKA70DRAFT_1450264 [Coprinopsis sp. MPI-PUGE-AT-0042]|nr:hypothetical protein BKA70DRAFT_1450264 [Coprinopsis sp. MPI-PUGE-AT-0042]
MTICDTSLHAYANSNEPLPDHLREPLDQFLNQLDTQWDVYERDRRCAVEAIDSRLSTIQGLEREIEAFKRLKERAIQGEEDLQSKKKRYGSSVAAFRRLPPEVIASIIGASIQGFEGFVHQQERLVFSQLRSVCRLWRETSFSTPSLWRAVGLDMGQIVASDHLVDVYGPLPTTVSDIIDFAIGMRFNVTNPSFFNPSRFTIRRNTVIQGFDSSEFLPSSKHVLDLNKNFPELVSLCLAEATVPDFTFPLAIFHKAVTNLHLGNTFLSSTEMLALLLGLPRLESLHLEHCEAKSLSIRTPYPSYSHRCLRILILYGTIPEDRPAWLTFPALKVVAIQESPSNILPGPDLGQKFGQLLQRCGNVSHFYLQGRWPAVLLDNITSSGAAIECMVVDLLSSFEASLTSGCRLVKTTSALRLIMVLQAVTESQLVEFCDLFTPSEGRAGNLRAPNCTPPTAAHYPWPRPVDGRKYVLTPLSGQVSLTGETRN